MYGHSRDAFSFSFVSFSSYFVTRYQYEQLLYDRSTRAGVCFSSFFSLKEPHNRDSLTHTHNIQSPLGGRSLTFSLYHRPSSRPPSS